MEKKFNEIVFKTGGTTSDGKGVVKTFENLKRECLDILSLIHISEPTRH